MPDNQIESKLLTSLEVKQVDTEGRTIEGYAATFGNLDLNGDVIDKKAFDNTLKAKKPADVAVFVGHNSSMLPIGIPVEMRTDEKGLYTKTRVFKTQAGDDLLQTARELHAAGQPLGMSIGFQTRDSKWQTKDGKTYRLLTDADLMEYSYAAKQVIASPPALVTAVKTRTKGAGMADHEHFAPGEQPVWSTAYIQSLPDAAFAYIEDGGEAVEGKTVPHGLRHFPHHNEDGSVNPEAVARELDRVSESPFKEYAHAHMRSHAMAEGIIGDGSKIATAAISEIASTFSDLSLESADVARALQMGTKLGFDGKKIGVRLKGTMRSKLKNIKAALDELLVWADNDDMEAPLATVDGKTRGGTAKRALERAQFAATIPWDGKTSAGELSLDDLHNALDRVGMAMSVLDAYGEKAAHKAWDPDGDGDDDSTPEGDTDHDHWSKDGRQLKPVPGKPLDGKVVSDEEEKRGFMNKARQKAREAEEDNTEEKQTGADAVEHLARALADLHAHHDAVHPDHDMRSNKLDEHKAEWTSAFINDLPDSAFAMIDSGGDKDNEGKTTPRSLRHYPHHNADGSVDLPHLRNAMARINQSGTAGGGDAAQRHLEAHAAKEGIGDQGEKTATPPRRNGKMTEGGYVAALKDMEATLSKYGVAIEA